MALLVGFMYHLLYIEIIRLLKKKRLDPLFSEPEINELNIYKLDPSELPGLSEIKSDEQVWNFFCEPDYKYANSKRANRNTGSGYWKITGKPLKVKDKTGKVIGSKKNLVYYKRVASKMVKTDWVMHEFYVKESSRYKKDFVFCYIEKNPNSKSNVSTPDDDQHQPSQSLASDAETYATEEASTEVESQQPSTHGLRNNSLEVESKVQSNHNLVPPDTGNIFVPNTSSMEEPQLPANQNLGFDPRNNFAHITLPMEVEPGPLSNHNLVSDQRNTFAPMASSMVQTQPLSVPNSESDPKYQFVPNTSSRVGSQLRSNHHMVFDHFASITSSMVESQLLSNQNLVSDSSQNHLMPTASSMVGSQLLSNHHMVFDHSASLASSMQVESQLLSNQNLVSDSSQNHLMPNASSMQVESQLLSNQNLVSDSSQNHLTPNASSMVAHHQLQSNHNVFSDPRNGFVPNPCLPVDLQQLAELFAQLSALFGSVSAPQWPLINPEHGSSSSYSNGFDNNCTLSSSQFHGELEDVWTAQRNFQDKYPDEATGQTLPADTDTDNTNAFVNGLFLDTPLN